jgi:hypothetical protein
MGSRADYLAKLAYWVGITEAPAGSNRTPIGESFGWQGVPWCAETVSEALRQSGSPWLREASVLMCRRRAEAGANGMVWVPRDGHIEAGMAVLFDWNGNGNPNDFHIGTVVDPGTQARFATIEGNYQDSVARVWRDRTYVQGFIRFPFPQPAPQPQPDPTPKGGDNMHVDARINQDMILPSGRGYVDVPVPTGYAVISVIANGSDTMDDPKNLLPKPTFIPRAGPKPGCWRVDFEVPGPMDIRLGLG